AVLDRAGATRLAHARPAPGRPQLHLLAVGERLDQAGAPARSALESQPVSGPQRCFVTAVGRGAPLCDDLPGIDGAACRAACLTPLREPSLARRITDWIALPGHPMPGVREDCECHRHSQSILSHSQITASRVA